MSQEENGRSSPSILQEMSTPPRPPPPVRPNAPLKKRLVPSLKIKRTRITDSDSDESAPKKGADGDKAYLGEEDVQALQKTLWRAKKVFQSRVECSICATLGEPDSDSEDYLLSTNHTRTPLLQCRNGHATCLRCARRSRETGNENCGVCRVEMKPLYITNHAAGGIREGLRRMKKLQLALTGSEPPVEACRIAKLANNMLFSMEMPVVCMVCRSICVRSLYKCSEPAAHTYCRNCAKRYIKGPTCALGEGGAAGPTVTYTEHRVGVDEHVLEAVGNLRHGLEVIVKINARGQELGPKKYISTRPKLMEHIGIPRWVYVEEVGDSQGRQLETLALVLTGAWPRKMTDLEVLKELYIHLRDTCAFGISKHALNLVFDQAREYLYLNTRKHAVDHLRTAFFVIGKSQCAGLKKDRDLIMRQSEEISAWCTLVSRTLHVPAAAAAAAAGAANGNANGNANDEEDVGEDDETDDENDSGVDVSEPGEIATDGDEEGTVGNRPDWIRGLSFFTNSLAHSWRHKML